MNNIIKLLIESKYNFNIDIDSNDDQSTLSKLLNTIETLIGAYNRSLTYMDLDLPSGTLWAKYNLGVNIDKLNDPKNWYGNYYAWGETEPKDEYTWSSYKLGNEYHLNKYVSNPRKSSTGKVDNLKQLEFVDDAAYQTDPIGKFCIPTKELFEELMKYTSYSWVKSYESVHAENSVFDELKQFGLEIPSDITFDCLNGILFKSKNGNELFLPAAGQFIDFDVEYTAISGHYWVSNVYGKEDEFAGFSHYASTFYFLENDVKLVGCERCAGFSIRPIKIKIKY